MVKNPGIKYTAPLIDFFVKNQVKIYTEIEIASWYLKNSHYGAITGTNGKTTITTMLYEILQVNHHAKAAAISGLLYAKLLWKMRQVSMTLHWNYQIFNCLEWKALNLM